MNRHSRRLVHATIAIGVLLGLAAGPAWVTAARISAPLVRFGPGREFGNVVYAETYEGTFSVEIELAGLRPSAPYALTLNGKPQSPGNDELMRLGKTTISGGIKEAHLDFQTIRAGADGTFRGRTLSVALSEGRYDVKFFVKDIERGWQVVLGVDVLQFTMQAAPSKNRPQIRITKLLPNVSIEGQVRGLTGDAAKYKVIVFVKTDKWYIHPFTHGGEGLSFASVKSDGSWQIKTVRREFPADEVVALLVETSYKAPFTIDDIDRIPALAKHMEEGRGRL